MRIQPPAKLNPKEKKEFIHEVMSFLEQYQLTWTTSFSIGSQYLVRLSGPKETTIQLRELNSKPEWLKNIVLDGGIKTLSRKSKNSKTIK